MKKSIMTAVVIIIVAIAAVGVGVYLATQGGGGGGGGTKNTYTVANATSLQLEANITWQSGVKVTQKWAAKNLNSTQLMLRLDLLGGEAGNYSYIFIASNQTAWSAENGTWTDTSSTFNDLWSIWGTQGTHWTNLVNKLANWSGTGDYTYTASTGESVRVYNISVNPSLEDSLFQP